MVLYTEDGLYTAVDTLHLAKSHKMPRQTGKEVSVSPNNSSVERTH